MIARCLLFLLSSWALAGMAGNGGPSAAERLTERMAGLEQIEAAFSQELIDGRGMVLRRSSGRLWAERPGRFRWEVDAPFAEVLIGDGETLWLWDPDLEQVTVRPYDARLRATPVRLLSGSAEELLEAFDVDWEPGGDAESDRFVLWPREGDPLFERLEFVFADELPRRLVVHDGMGQRTVVELHDVRGHFDADPDRFRFEIPEGVDVLYEEAEPDRHE